MIFSNKTNKILYVFEYKIINESSTSEVSSWYPIRNRLYVRETLLIYACYLLFLKCETFVFKSMRIGSILRIYDSPTLHYLLRID